MSASGVTLIARAPQRGECEVYVEGAWRPALILRAARDGWVRVLVDCYGRVRELTFSPLTTRYPKSKDRA